MDEIRPGRFAQRVSSPRRFIGFLIDSLDRLVRSRAPLLLVVVFLNEGHAYAQSFDCSRAGTAVEHAICEDKTLGDLDVALSHALADVLSGAPEQRKVILGVQRRWLADRDTKCWVEGLVTGSELVTCLVGFYQSRIQELDAIAKVRAETQSVGPEEAGRLSGTWEGYYGPNATPVQIVIQKNTVYETNGDWVCGKHDYRVIGQKDDRFFLEVGTGHDCGQHLIMISSLSEDGFLLSFCSSAQELLKLSHDDRTADCHDNSYSKLPESAEARAAELDDRERQSFCRGHRLTERQVELIRAVEFNQAERVRQILTQPVDVNFLSHSGSTPLGSAVVDGNLKFVRELLKAGAKRRVVIAGCPHDSDVLGLVPLNAPASNAIRKALLDSPDPGPSPGH